MKPYLCQKAEIVNEQGKNPYLRLTFVDTNVQSSNNPFTAILGNRPVTIVVSGGFFTSDRKPDFQQNLAWCTACAPKFENQTADLETFSVDVEPYYKLDNSGKIMGGLLNKMSITTFAVLDATTGEISPLFGWDNVANQARNRLANGTTMYKTKSQFDAETAATAQIAAVNGMQQPQQPQQQPQQPINPFMQMNANMGANVPPF